MKTLLMLGGMLLAAISAHANIGDTLVESKDRQSVNLRADSSFDEHGKCNAVVFTHHDKTPFSLFEVDTLVLANTTEDFTFTKPEAFGTRWTVGSVMVNWFVDGSLLHPVQHVQFEKPKAKPVLANN